MTGIYKIENNITKDIYVGSSCELKNRKKRHFKDLKKGKHHSIILQRAVNKYGIENFVFEIIEYCDKEVLIEREQLYLDSLKPLYNIALIAGSNLGIKQSEESKLKKRKYALENNIRPPESTWIEKQKPVLMLEYNSLQILHQFQSLSEACKYLNKDVSFCSTISSCCENKRYSAFGYRWCYLDFPVENLRKKKKRKAWNKGLKINKKGKKVKQYDLQMNFLKEWESVKEAELIFGKGISNCALGRSKSSNGYIWKY